MRAKGTDESEKDKTDARTLMDMRTDLTAAPRACLRNPNPERTRKVVKSLGVFKRKRGQKLKTESVRQDDDGRSQLQSERRKLKSWCRYVGVANSDITRSNGASSLVAVPNDLPLPPA